MRSVLCVALFAPAIVMAEGQVQAEQVSAGKALYKAHCALCHGSRGQGVPPMFPDLVSKPPEAHAAMMQNYRAGHGHKVMVDMAKSLNERQIDDLMLYIATFPPKK